MLLILKTIQMGNNNFNEDKKTIFSNNSYTVKEILTDHIDQQRDCSKQILKELKEIRTLYASKKMVLQLSGYMATLISALSAYVFLGG